ncbi:sporulation-specific diadenylate cyclase CdaS [Cohnella sp. AR92]|uniref:sporulation-specific diadenylate cyclase CdaS n=1 Tax=Cohnella sp. AR92 TaxID=648716 RepID=UPI001EDDA8F4|nr:sporulation-specific diadenylate cyclase CdaS [Cohnella sp. AR92]
MECSSEGVSLESVDLRSQFSDLSVKVKDILSSLGEDGEDLLRDLRQLSKSFTDIAQIASTYHLTRLLDPYTNKCSEIFRAVRQLSAKRTGALIVIERYTPLEERITAGIPLDAELSAALLESIFNVGTPLHDGAVIIRNDRIVSAANVLPLTKKAYSHRKMGTRHRAAIGLSEHTDSLVFVVSEETGKESFAYDGFLYPFYFMERE